MKGMNLRKKAVFIVAGILFFIILINTAVLTFIASEKYRNAILAKTSALGEGLQKDLSKVLSLGVAIESLEGINEKLKDLASRDRSIGYAMITDGSGKVLFHSDPSLAGQQLKDKVSRNAATADRTLVQATASFYDVSFPLLNADGKVTGALRLGVRKETINSQLYQLLLWALGASLLCFLLSLLLVHFSISKFITNPITTMEKAADRIASGDLSCEVTVKGRDELASLGNAINRMVANLKDMLSKISGITNSVSGVTANISASSHAVMSVADVQKKAIEETSLSIKGMDDSISRVASSTIILSQSAGDTSSSIFEMSASIERVAENANIFNETAHETASSIEEMVSSIRQIAESIENLSTSAEAIASSIDEVNAATRDIERSANESVGLAETVVSNATVKGMSAANAAMEGMTNIRKSVTDLSEVINVLGKRTDDIGKILNVIDDVADQTNLLALNAAILASKAGEHGKGFSIVADEIKSLAERTSVSTNEIASLIQSVQEVTKSSMRMASGGIQTVEKGMRLVTDVNSALGEIVESSRASMEMAKSIQRATTEESSVIKQITDAVETMTTQTENISRAIQEQSRGSKLIIEASEKVKELSTQVKNSTGEQKDGSRQIADVIENITQQAAQIADATGKQKENSVEIVRSMDKIRSTTDKLMESSTEMSVVINSLKDEALNLLFELQKFRT